MSRKREKHRKNSAARRALRNRVLARDKNECLRCGSKENLTIDRICSGAEGGKYVFENCQTLCADCNQVKGKHCISYLASTWAKEPPKPEKPRYSRRWRVEEILD